MKIINIVLYIIASIAVAMAAGCANSENNVSEHHHDESLQLTSYNNLFEVFAEVSPLVVGNEAEIVAHFTWIDGFKSLESGTVTATINVGGKTISQSAETPARQGKYILKRYV